MTRHSKETGTPDLGEIVSNGGVFILTLDRSKYKRPQDCNCGVRYKGHGTEYPSLPQVFASWKQEYFRRRYYHRETNQCNNDGKSLRVGPDADLSKWAVPLLESLYVLGASNAIISRVLPESVATHTRTYALNQ